MDHDIAWNLGIDPAKHLLPLDEQAIAFPGASAEQELALSQFMGLVVNATISEMEDALPRLKLAGWDRILRQFPVGPELRTLGEMFFDEEAKHARVFKRYLSMFAEAHAIDYDELDQLLPKAFGSFFQKAVTQNAVSGGHAFWWVVASVEEVSIAIYQQMFRNRRHIDPLYMNIHKRHLEEESRHANYAFLMLNLIARQTSGLSGYLHKKVDFLFAQLVGAPWVVTELQKFFKVRELRSRHPLFDVLASCIPLFEAMPRVELVRRMFLAAPYVSWLLNPTWRKLHEDVARAHGSFVPPFPEVQEVAVRCNVG